MVFVVNVRRDELDGSAKRSLFALNVRRYLEIVKMPEPIKLTLPYPPALNNLYFTIITKARIGQKSRPIRVLSDEGKAFHAAVNDICGKANIQPVIGDVGITFRAYRPRRIGDLDGTFKIVFDALKGHAYADDKQISEIVANRYEDPKNPRVEIEIRALNLL